MTNLIGLVVDAITPLVIARQIAQRNANITENTYLIYRCTKDSGSEGHHIVESLQIKGLCDDDDDLEFVERVEPNVRGDI